MDDAEREKRYREAMAARRAGEACPLCGQTHSALSPCMASAHPTTYPEPPRFGGRTYDPAKDGQRLGKQLARVLDCMKDGQWRTLREIAHATGDPEASVSARLRDFRKQPFGGHEMDAERIPSIDRPRGTWRYRLRLQLRDNHQEAP